MTWYDKTTSTFTATVTVTETARVTATTVATMAPNGDEDNKDINSKNIDKAMTLPTTTREGG